MQASAQGGAWLAPLILPLQHCEPLFRVHLHARLFVVLLPARCKDGIQPAAGNRGGRGPRLQKLPPSDMALRCAGVAQRWASDFDRESRK